MSGYTLTVGKPYSPSGQQVWPDNSPHWVISEELVELAMFIPGPTPEERTEFQYGRVKFGLVAGDHALVLGVKLGAMPWWDGPWQARRQTVTPPGLPDVADGKHTRVLMVLVHSRTGLVEEMRVISWPSRFTQAVRKALLHQLDHASEDRAGEIEVNTLYERYTTSADLMRHRADLIVNGGPGAV